MLPPKQEGDPAISNQYGFNPFPLFPENSIELVILSERNSRNRRNLIRKLLVEGYSDFRQEDIASPFLRFQNGLLNAISESKYLMVQRDKDNQFLSVREDFLSKLADSFTFEVLLSEHTPMFSEINKELLLLVEERLRDLIKRKSFDEFDFDYKESGRLENLARFAFSNNVDSQMSIIANLVLVILNQRAWQNKTRSTLIIDLTTAVNHLNPDVKKRFDNWKKASVQTL